MPYILIIETATDTCSVAIAQNGEILALREQHECPSHVAVITRMIESCLQEAGVKMKALGAVAVSSGPGSYTSLRTGVATAKGLCYALDIPLISVNTLMALAAGCFEQSHETSTCISMLDARRNEVWLAAYNRNLDTLAPPQSLILEGDNFNTWIEKLPDNGIISVSGNGKTKIKNTYLKINTDICTINRCSARYLGNIAQKKLELKKFENIALFDPFYMKPPNITVSKKTSFLD